MGQSKKNYIINRDFDHFKDSIRYMMNSVPKKIDPMVSRTYMPGYDMQDWLTLKTDEELYTAIQIVNISTENHNSFYSNDKEDLYIYFNKIEIKERPSPVNTNGLKNMLRWELNRWGDNCISYRELLKDYRPLTETEKLLYAKEE